MNRLCWVAMITSSLVCMTGCRTAGDATVKRGNPITPENFSRIVDKQWTLRMIILDGEVYGLTGDRPYVRFNQDNNISGFASVNRFSGSIQWDDEGNIQWSPLRSTRMAGPFKLMTQERTFLEALPRVQRLSLEGIHLHAQSNDKQVELVFYVPVN